LSKDTVEWEKEFAENTSSQAKTWEDEFIQESTDINIDGDPQEALSKTAGLLLNVVESATNPKFKESKFLGFMKQIRDKAVTIEGDKVVQVIHPVGEGSWAREFGEGVAQPSASTMEQMMAQNGPASAAADWAQEFSGGTSSSVNRGMWEEEFSTQMDHRQPESISWGSEFEQFSKSNTDQMNDSTDAAMDQAFAQASMSSRVHALEPVEPVDSHWDAMEEAWNEQQQSSSSTHNNYVFVQNNPLMDRPLEFLENVSVHRNLTESILALEAAVQKNPSNAQSWKHLGLRQQENENEEAALAALGYSVALDPSVLESWLGLSVSYTNEGRFSDSYQALESWIKNNPKYEHLIGPSTAPPSHDRLVEILMRAARMNISQQDLDPDVQIALGVLFNISREFEKAVDCFEAAISKLPHVQLYNLFRNKEKIISSSLKSNSCRITCFGID
jgi:peroxin-5